MLDVEESLLQIFYIVDIVLDEDVHIYISQFKNQDIGVLYLESLMYM